MVTRVEPGNTGWVSKVLAGAGGGEETAAALRGPVLWASAPSREAKPGPLTSGNVSSVAGPGRTGEESRARCPDPRVVPGVEPQLLSWVQSTAPG